MRARLSLVAVALLMLAVAPWRVTFRAAASEVQPKVSIDVFSCSSTPTGLAFDSSVITGNAIIVVVNQGASSTSITASDSTNGAYDATASNYGASNSTVIRSKRNVTGGSITVDVACDVTGNAVTYLYEVSGLDNGASPVTGTNSNTGSPTSHNCASSGLSGTGFAVCGAMLTGGTGATAGSGWAELVGPNDARFSQRQVGTLSNDQGPFTTTSGENSETVMAIFAEAASAGGFFGFRSMTGVGK